MWIISYVVVKRLAKFEVVSMDESQEYVRVCQNALLQRNYRTFYSKYAISQREDKNIFRLFPNFKNCVDILNK